MKLISIVTPCYNEAANIQPLYERIKSIRENYPQYRFEHIVIDNASTDQTPDLLRAFAQQDRQLKIIFNTRNFGHIRSPYYALLQAQGDAVIMLASDLQDPPELIHNFIRQWEAGFKIVIAVKPTSEETKLIAMLRRLYYTSLARIAETPIVKNFTGFGLYDRQVINALCKYQNDYPYFRGMIAELGYDIASINFNQPKRTQGKTKNNIYTLYDMAMLGFITHTRVPIRLATLFGICLAFGAMFYGCFNLFNNTSIAIPAIIFILSIQFIFIGLLGEYLLAIHRQIFKRPLVIEKMRINFEEHT